MRKRELERRLLAAEAAEQRFYDWQNQVPRWGQGWLSTAGPYANPVNTAGIPTASACIRLVSESLGMMPLKIYRGDPPNRTVARDTWQWERLHDEPNDAQSAFEFWQDVSTSIEATGNAYVWKAVTRRPVQDPADIQLLLLDPATVKPRRSSGRKVFDIWRDGEKTTYTPQQILHVRGWAFLGDGIEGVSPVAQHRETLGKSLATEEFESRFFSNNARPSGVIEVPGDLREGEADRLKQHWYDKYGGLGNAHTPALLINGAQWKPTGINLQDAQLIEQKRWNAEDIARIFRVSALPLLGVFPQGVRPPTVDEALDQFLQVDMGPRMARVEQALAADPDLFPEDDSLFPEFLADAVLRPALQSRYAAYKDALQAGWMTSNEVRERENLAPHPDGEILQQTPVGGAPNQTPAPGAPANGNGKGSPPGDMTPMQVGPQ